MAVAFVGAQPPVLRRTRRADTTGLTSQPWATPLAPRCLPGAIVAVAFVGAQPPVLRRTRRADTTGLTPDPRSGDPTEVATRGAQLPPPAIPIADSQPVVPLPLQGRPIQALRPNTRSRSRAGSE